MYQVGQAATSGTRLVFRAPPVSRLPSRASRLVPSIPDRRHGMDGNIRGRHFQRVCSHVPFGAGRPTPYQRDEDDDASSPSEPPALSNSPATTAPFLPLVRDTTFMAGDDVLGTVHSGLRSRARSAKTKSPTRIPPSSGHSPVIPFLLGALVDSTDALKGQRGHETRGYWTSGY